MREQMSNMIREMEEHHTRIRNTIRTLENDADARSPNARQMLMHVRELEEQLRLMEQDPGAELHWSAGSAEGRRCVRGHRLAEQPVAGYSTVTDLARFLGWSTSQPRLTAMW